MIQLIKVCEKIRWYKVKHTLRSCGNKSDMGMFFIIKGANHITIGSDCHFGRYTELAVWNDDARRKSKSDPEMMIGNNVNMAGNCYISCSNRVEIGDGCLLGMNTFISDNLHGEPSDREIDIEPNIRTLYSKGPVVLEENVLTGRNVCIMPGVTIGRGSIVGANAVVTHNVPPFSVVAGVPAVVLRKLV